MKMPSAEKAEIAPEKLWGYLLDLDHRRGGTKARFLYACGYRGENWERLQSDLREQHLNQEVSLTHQTSYGQRFEIVAPLATPSGRSVVFRSVWQIDTGTDHPRLITMYPE
jgi:hypothetical protein